ncbi:MAG TPA: hypothetical protein VGB70_06030 [Allosphingosinicella sp.]|jgi:hypothetical protein
MPRFYFDVHDEVLATDEDGLDLAGPDAAIEEAHRGARDLAAAQVLGGRLNLNHRIIVRDKAGVIAEVSFRQAVTLTE